MFNQSRLLAEAVRQGEYETESRIRMTQVLQGRVGDTKVDPLAEYYQNDKEIARIQIDVSGLKHLLTRQYATSPLVVMPCFWPHQLLLGMPCTFCCCTLPAMDAKCRAHHLILRENSILYQVDPYDPLTASANTQQLAMKPWCSACCSVCIKDFDPIYEVIPLTEVSDAKVEECLATGCCGVPTAPNTFTVKIMGQMFPSVAIDCPLNGEELSKKIMDQKTRATPPPPNLLQEWKSKQMVGMMGMGGVGVSMMAPQAQLMMGQNMQQNMLQPQLNVLGQQNMMMSTNPLMMATQQQMMQQSVMQQQAMGQQNMAMNLAPPSYSTATPPYPSTSSAPPANGKYAQMQ
jgi:hypothetical protein